MSLQLNHNTPLLVHAATVSAKKAKQPDVSFILKKTLNAPGTSTEIRKKLSIPEPIPMTPDEALAVLIEDRLSKHQYMKMRLRNKKRNSDIYPTYQRLLDAKLKCRPSGVHISETVAQVPLQNLLDHTVDRIVLMQHEVFKQFSDISEVKLIASYGFDGSSGQSMYKQRFETERSDSTDQSLFVTTLVPLKLLDHLDKVLWINSTPQSIRFCRPIKIEFAKETAAHILEEKVNLDTQISNLKPFMCTVLQERSIKISYDLNMTLIDGKVLNILTGTNSCQCCPICGSKPTQFLKTVDLKSECFQSKPGTLCYGVSPLHAWIRFLEFVLKISYRIGINKWQIRGAKDKSIMETRKYEIQRRLWAEMGLHIDKPKQNGSGNTNDGNTARRAFSNIELFASILNFDKDVLKHFHTILITISCDYEVNVDKFQNYCERAATLYMSKYPWYPMSATVHKILIHGS